MLCLTLGPHVHAEVAHVNVGPVMDVGILVDEAREVEDQHTFAFLFERSAVDGFWGESRFGWGDNEIAEALKEAGEDCNSLEGCNIFGCPDCEFCANGFDAYGRVENFPALEGMGGSVGYPAFGSPYAEGKYHIERCYSSWASSSCAASSDEECMQDNNKKDWRENSVCD